MSQQSAQKSSKANGVTGKSGNASDESLSKKFSEIANRIAREMGRARSFMVALGVIVVWAVTGPVFHYSDTWQLVINTGTTIITFLMVFLIQNSQNRDGAAIQVKLDELIRVSRVHNKFVGIEHLTEEELHEIRGKCETRAKTETLAVRTERKAEKAAEKATT